MNIRGLLVAVSLIPAIYAPAYGQKARPSSPADQFWNGLVRLCGKAFTGTVEAAPEGDTTFADKTLVMHVRSCEKTRIRIPFVVDDDRSRTWVLTKRRDRIELRHDHRHQDGSPDSVTMYGGWTTSVGTLTRQIFPADDQTVKVITAAAANVWWIDLTNQAFIYNLRRLGTDRYFSIKFDLSKPVPPPAAPWGWKD
jgi:hypothetical protein